MLTLSELRAGPRSQEQYHQLKRFNGIFEIFWATQTSLNYSVADANAVADVIVRCQKQQISRFAFDKRALCSLRD